MRTYAKQPDLLPEILDKLESELPSYHFAGDLSGWSAPEEWITIQSSGGQIFSVRGGVARFDVNVYGPAKPTAFNIALDVIKALQELENFTTNTFVITEVTCSYPADISDPINSNPRYVFDLDLAYRKN